MISRYVLALTASLSPCVAHATDTPANIPTDADTILVVGQQNRPIEIAPRGLAVSLGQEQLRAINAFNTEDLMKYAPNFFVRKRYAGDSNGVPGFRGTHSTQSARTLVMVDGFVVSNFLGNSFAYSPKWGVVGPGEVEQFDIVYGPYSSRYVGNSMGGIVNITTRNPDHNEAFVKVQGMVEPYRQFSTKADYWGGSVEGGFGWKPKDSPWSLRITARHFRNTGQPMSFYGLVPISGTAGTVVSGAVVDPAQLAASAAGTGLENVPAGQATPAVAGSAKNPIFAAQSPATITQDQAKVKLGFDNGTTTGQILFAFWHNLDAQEAPDCYLRDAGGARVCEGTVRIGTQSYTASGANWSRTVRNEYLLGAKLGQDLGDGWKGRIALSTYQIALSNGFTSTGYANGATNGAGTLAQAGPTAWYTGDMAVERHGATHDLALGITASLYRIDTRNWALTHWRSEATRAFSTETYGKTRILSAWAEDTYHLSPNLRVSAGVRVDDWRAFDGGLGRVGTGTMGTGGIVYNAYGARHAAAANPTLSLQADLSGTLVQLSLAMATRFPTVGELYQGSLNGDGTFNINSFDPNLKPERSKDANLLVSRKLPLGAGHMKLTGSAFYQRVEDTLFQFYGFNQNGVASSTFKNIDLTRQYGVEGIVEARDWPLRGISIEANGAYTNSVTLRNTANPLANGVSFPRIPTWRINGHARYDVTAAVQASLGLRYASRPNTDLFGLQRGDAFGFTSELFALDARVSWRITDTITAAAGVDNLTNMRAYVFHPYPQRTFLMELGWHL